MKWIFGGLTSIFNGHIDSRCYFVDQLVEIFHFVDSMFAFSTDGM